MSEFSDKLRNIREDKDLTQETIAQSIPMNQSNYSKIERGIQEPNLYQLKRIAELLDVSIDELLSVKGEGLTVNDLTDLKFAKEIKSIYDKYYSKK